MRTPYQIVEVSDPASEAAATTWWEYPLTQKVVQILVRHAARRAQVRAGVHILRQAFCSHLAMRGAPARAIQELAGHQDLSTTQRYMHLSPAALDAAIRLLEGGLEEPTRAALEK
jgi:site-specific recombinase XerD